MAPPLKGLTGPVTITRRIIMQKARGHAGPKPAALPPLVGVGFQVQCPPLSGFFPPFGRPTGFAIGRHRVLSLGGWAPQIQAGFHVPDPTRVPARVVSAAPTGLSPAVARLSRPVRLAWTDPTMSAPRPRMAEATRFRLVPVRSPLLGESRLLSAPPGTEMFQFPGSDRAFQDRCALGRSPGHFAAFHARYG
jgi:hypothetical protein